MTDEEDGSFFDFSNLKKELGEGDENWEEKLLETKKLSSQDSNKETTSSSPAGNDLDIQQSNGEQKIPSNESSAILRGDVTSFFNDSSANHQQPNRDSSSCNAPRLDGLILNNESIAWTSMLETQKQLQQQEHRDANATVVQTADHGVHGSASRVDNTAVPSTPPQRFDTTFGNDDVRPQPQGNKKDVMQDFFASPSRDSRRKPPKRKATRRFVPPEQDLEEDLSGSSTFTPDNKRGKFSESGLDRSKDRPVGSDSVVPAAELELEEAEEAGSNMMYDTSTVKSPLEQPVSHIKFNAALLAGSVGVRTSTPVRATQGSARRGRLNLTKATTEDDEQPTTDDITARGFSKFFDISTVPDSDAASGDNDGDGGKNKIDDTGDRVSATRGVSTVIRRKQFVYPSDSQVQVGMSEYRRNLLMGGNPDVFDIPMTSVRLWNEEQLNKLTLYANLRTTDFSDAANVPDKPDDDRSSPSDKKDPDDRGFDDLPSPELFRGSGPNATRANAEGAQSSGRPETSLKQTQQLVGDQKEFAKENFSESVFANPVGSFQSFQLASGKGVHISSSAKARAEKLVRESLGDLACPIVAGNMEADAVSEKERCDLSKCKNFEVKYDKSGNVVPVNVFTSNQNLHNVRNACSEKLPPPSSSSSSLKTHSNPLRFPVTVGESDLEPESFFRDDSIGGFLSKNADLTESQILEVRSSSAIMLQQDEVFSSQCCTSSEVSAPKPEVSELSSLKGMHRGENRTENVAGERNSGTDIDAKTPIIFPKKMVSAERLDINSSCNSSTSMRDCSTLTESKCELQEQKEVIFDARKGDKNTTSILEARKSFVVTSGDAGAAPASETTLYEDPKKIPSVFVGFKTASGNKVNLNSNAMEKAKKLLLADELSCPGPPGEERRLEFETAKGGTKISTGLDQAKEVQDIFDVKGGGAGARAGEGRQNDLTSSEKYFINMDDRLFDAPDPHEKGEAISGRAGGFSGFGFTTAGGNKIKVNQESLEKVKEMFGNDDPGILSPVRNDRVGAMQEPDVGSTVGKNFPVFQTAKGKPVHASEEAIAQVKLLFNEEGLSGHAKKEFQVPENHVEASKCRGNVSNDALHGTGGPGYRPPMKKTVEHHSRPTGDREDVRDSFSVHLESERRNQKLLIASKLKSKSHSRMLGSLTIAKTDETNKNKRLNIKDAVRGKRPTAHSIEDLLDNGVLPGTVQVTSSNAESHRFDVFDTSETSAVKPMLVTDGGVVIPDDAGKIGKEEFHLALLAAPGVSPSSIDESWTYNHYRWIVWKLASMETAFPYEFGGRCLTVDVVFSQLRYRYDAEVALSRRSALKKICERDDTSKKALVLCVSRIESAVHGRNFRLHLTDGWYSLPAVVDESLCSLVISKKINVGTKLVTFGSELVGSDEACPPLNAPQSLALKIHGNSTRRAAWFSKLGFSYTPLPRLSLISLRQDGGQIACLDLLVLRVYSLLYHEKYPDGGQGTVRSERLEKKFADDFESTRQKALEKFYEKFEKEFREKPRKTSRIDDDSDEGCSSGSLRGAGRRNDETSMNSFVAAKMQAEGSKLPKRIVTPLLKVKVASCHKRDLPSKCATILTVWNPTEDVMELMKEGTRFLAVNLVPSREKFNNILTLNANKMTQYKKLNANVDFLKGIHTPRAVTSFREIVEADGPPDCDIVGTVLKVSNGSFFQKSFSGLSETVFMVDVAGSFGAVLFLGGLCAHGLDSVMKTGTTVACCNLKPWKVSTSPRTSDHSTSFSSYFDHSRFRSPVAALKSDVTSDFFCRPQQSHLAEALESMTSKMNGDKNFLEDALKELERILDSREQRSATPVLKRMENRSAEVRKKMIGVARTAVTAMPMNTTFGGQLQSMFEEDDELFSNICLSQNKTTLTHARPSGLKKRSSDGNFSLPVPKRKKPDQNPCDAFPPRVEKENALENLQDVVDGDRGNDEPPNQIEKSSLKPDPTGEKPNHISGESLPQTTKEVPGDVAVVDDTERADDRIQDELRHVEEYAWDSEFF